MPNETLTYAQCEDLKDWGLEQDVPMYGFAYYDRNEKLHRWANVEICREHVYAKLPSNDELEEFGRDF